MAIYKSIIFFMSNVYWGDILLFQKELLQNNEKGVSIVDQQILTCIDLIIL